MNTGRVLAVDYGEVNLGLAISDPLGLIAQPLPAQRRVGSRKDLVRLAATAREREATTVVFGLPLTLSGAEGEAARTVRDFASQLAPRLAGIALEFWDERLTTVEAERVLIAGDTRRSRRREVIDGLAAALILQGYLDARCEAKRNAP